MARYFQFNARNKLTAKFLLTFSRYIRPHLAYLVHKFNVCFIRLENPVYLNNPFIIHTIEQSSIQHTTLNQLNITKHIFLYIIFHQH